MGLFLFLLVALLGEVLVLELLRIHAVLLDFVVGLLLLVLEMLDLGGIVT